MVLKKLPSLKNLSLKSILIDFQTDGIPYKNLFAAAHLLPYINLEKIETDFYNLKKNYFLLTKIKKKLNGFSQIIKTHQNLHRIEKYSYFNVCTKKISIRAATETDYLE